MVLFDEGQSRRRVAEGPAMVDVDIGVRTVDVGSVGPVHELAPVAVGAWLEEEMA